jgi:hypothetical protein
MDTDYPGVSAQIEGFTGSRQSYGLDKPINVLDIMEHVSLAVGLLVLEYANVDTLCATLAIAVLQGNMDPWFAGDVRLSNFLSDAALYLQTKDNPVTPKLDYCGDPIPGFYGVIPLSQLTDAYASMKASSDALDLNAGTTYADSYWILQGAPYTPAQIAYYEATLGPGGATIDVAYVNTVDPIMNAATPIPGYDTPISAFSTNPNVFSNDSATFDAQTPSGTQYGLLVHQPINQSGAPPVSYTNTAIQMLVSQLSLLLTMLTQDVTLLAAIVSGVQNYMLQFATEQRLQLAASLARLNELAITGDFSNPTDDPAVSADEQTINNAALNTRSTLLHDLGYIMGFSSDTLTISATDRANMENDVRAQMRATRKATAESLLATRQAQYDGLADLYSDARIVGILTPYLL